MVSYYLENISVMPYNRLPFAYNLYHNEFTCLTIRIKQFSQGCLDLFGQIKTVKILFCSIITSNLWLYRERMFPYHINSFKTLYHYRVYGSGLCTNCQLGSKRKATSIHHSAQNCVLLISLQKAMCLVHVSTSVINDQLRSLIA